MKHPISYSKQTRNVRRVALILGSVWLISIGIAAPMFLGINVPPDGAAPSPLHPDRAAGCQEVERSAGQPMSEKECRFYNADFILWSSMISFGAPLVIVLFVYARIMLAIHERERLSRLRLLPSSPGPVSRLHPVPLEAHTPLLALADGSMVRV